MKKEKKSFIGILCCGGRGTRLGNITKYISKAFVPVYDRPVFMYPMAQLEASKYVKEIIILSNEENDAKLRQTGHCTIIQDDNLVHDMFSGLAFIRKVTRENKSAVLMPCDNISEMVVDDVIEMFIRKQPDILVNTTRVESVNKLKEMGVFNSCTGTIEYKPEYPSTHFGVIAPFIVGSDVELSGDEEAVMNRCGVCHVEYNGTWFDVGDSESLFLANQYVKKKAKKRKSADHE